MYVIENHSTSFSMVGRRARGARTHLGVVDLFCASPKRKDSKLDFSGKLSHSPTNQKQRSVVDEFIKTDNRKTKLNLTMDPFRATSKYEHCVFFIILCN